MLAPLRGLALLVVSALVVGAATGIVLGHPAPERIRTGGTVALDILAVLGGVTLAWNAHGRRRGLRNRGLLALLGAASVITTTMWLSRTLPPEQIWTAPALVGRALAAIGTGILTVDWLRSHAGAPTSAGAPVRCLQRATAPVAFVGLMFCVTRVDTVLSPYLPVLHAFSATLVVGLVRAPHTLFGRALARIGRIGRIGTTARAGTPAPPVSRPTPRPSIVADPAAAQPTALQPVAPPSVATQSVDLRSATPTGHPGSIDLTATDSHASNVPTTATNETTAPDTTIDPGTAIDPSITIDPAPAIDPLPAIDLTASADPSAGASADGHDDRTTGRGSVRPGVYVGRSGRLIDLDRIPTELRLRAVRSDRSDTAGSGRPGDHTG